jgi:cytochrome c1
MKTIEIKEIYEKLNGAKITKMDDADKFKVIKALRELKPIANDYDDFVMEAQEKLKDDDHDKKIEIARRWQHDGDKSTLTEKEKFDLNKYFQTYQNKVSECVKMEAEKDNELKFEKLTEEAFSKLISSNDFELGDILKLQDALMKLK